MARKVTINMVADRAGVSRGTVDRVLNQRPHVKPELYDRIVQAMKELGYMPPKEEQAKALGFGNIIPKSACTKHLRYNIHILPSRSRRGSSLGASAVPPA